MDLFEVTVEVAGERQTAWLFVLHLMYSGHDFPWLYERFNQIAFLDAHVRAFKHFASVVVRWIYDNLQGGGESEAGDRAGTERSVPGVVLALSVRAMLRASGRES